MRYAAILGTALGLTLVNTASAEVYQIPAVAFVFSNIDKGVLGAVQSDPLYYAPVPFHGEGQVCAFVLTYTDTAYKQSVTAQLFKKQLKNGDDILKEPIVMAEADSAKSGRAPITRRKIVKTITDPTVNSATDFLYVSLSFSAIGPIKVAGVQVEVLPSCVQ